VVYGAALGATWAGWQGSLAGLVLVIFLAFLCQVLSLFGTGIDKESFEAFNRQLLLLFYLPFLFVHLLFLWDLPGGRALVAMVFLVAWGGDAFAYYTGRARGRRKLAPAISPNKTVEGSLGGVVGGGFFALLLAFTGLVPLPWYQLVFLGMLANVVGQVGDLFESYLKRLGGSKDSGRLIPGHGGMLDRLDSILFAGPLIYYGIRLLN
jgi:phosphatidate cytidylyltransferase